MTSPSDPIEGLNGSIQAGLYYSRGIPYLPMESYPGKLIAIEGTDGVGRSTQIQLLREWLEVKGYGVVETGWTRSPLMQPTIEVAKSSNTLNKLTFVLLYATDFADRLEKEIIPALKAGFVVLSDRYIFTALARAGVRGVDRAWLRSVYSFAIAPHLVFYLNIDVKTLISRVLAARGMDFWESGMDLKTGDDIYDRSEEHTSELQSPCNLVCRLLLEKKKQIVLNIIPSGTALRLPDKRVVAYRIPYSSDATVFM